MEIKTLRTDFESYGMESELSPADLDLVSGAKAGLDAAYAPYSRFRVSALARFSDGTFVAGTNQENAASPAGLCAERTLLAAASSLYPGKKIVAMAITYKGERGLNDRPISPCGICRQSLVEWEQRQSNPIRILLTGERGPVFAFNGSGGLLPLAFIGSSMT